MNYPSISIIIAARNSERTLAKCLSSIRSQNYPQEKIEIILVDAGSTDKTLQIAREYRCKILKKAGVAAEAAKAYGLQKAKGELFADFGSDNILPEKGWLAKIIRPLQENDEVIASYPSRYAYRKEDSIYNRYTALFGVNDPVPFYLGKADKQSYLYPNIAAGSKHMRSSNSNYLLVKFTTEDLPTVGANGFVIWKKILQKAKVDPENYFHIDVVYDLVKMGYNKFTLVNAPIIHNTADTLFSLLKKRKKYFSELYLEKKDKRRYHIVQKSDYPKLALFVFYSLTFVQPLTLSLQGYLRKRDIAWFVHPIFCFLITVAYIKTTVIYWLIDVNSCNDRYSY